MISNKLFALINLFLDNPLKCHVQELNKFTQPHYNNLNQGKQFHKQRVNELVAHLWAHDTHLHFNFYTIINDSKNK